MTRADTEQRRIVRVDNVNVQPFDDARLGDGWEVVVLEGEKVDVFHLWQNAPENWRAWRVSPRESWGDRHACMGDALMHILDPITPESDDPAPRRIPRGAR